MQNHRHTLSRVKQVSQIPQADQVTEEIKTLLREDSFPSVMVEVPVALRVNKIRPEKVADDDDNWGPGGLVVDGFTEARSSTKLSEAPSNSPWWAKPTDTLDAKTSKKLGLKPLQLQKSDVRTHNETSKHASSQSSKQLEIATAMKEVGHERQLQQQLERGRVSPGQPKTGRRRRKTSRNISRDTTGPSQRPLPADIPESPFSARRFTRHDVRLDTLRSNHRPSRSKLSNNVGEGFRADARDEVYQTSALPKPAQPKSPERVQHPLRPLGLKIAAADKFSTISAASHETFGDQRHVPLRRTALEEEPLPTVPVATLPPAKLHSSDSVDKNRGGTFAAAAQAARRQLTARERDRNGIPAKRTSLSSLRDFIAAEIPDDRQSQAKEHARVNKVSEVSEDDGDDQEEEEASVVNVERLVLGPMDLTSPNRKGSKLVLKAKLELCELSLEWQPEKKVILSVPFDAIRTLQVSR